MIVTRIKANEGVSINFIDTANKFQGWKTILNKPGAWIQYNSVDFGKKPLKNITVRALSATGGTLQVRINSINGPILAEIKIPHSNNWENIKAPVTKFEAGIHNLFVILKDNSNVEVDWISFD